MRERGEGRMMLWLVGTYLLISVASLAVFVGLVIALPRDYFAARGQSIFKDRPILRVLAVVAKNLLGLTIIVLGILLSLPGMPGQGLLTIAIGAMLLDFPGKQRLVRAVIGRPGVLSRINALRRMFGRSPLAAPIRGAHETLGQIPRELPDGVDADS